MGNSNSNLDNIPSLPDFSIKVKDEGLFVKESESLP